MFKIKLLYVKNFLLLILFIPLSSISLIAQDNWTELFSDDFEEGTTDKWELYQEEENASWIIDEENNNKFLVGENWGATETKVTTSYPWSDYSFKFKLKLFKGNTFLRFRISPKGEYFLAFSPNSTTLIKNVVNPDSVSTIAELAEKHEFDKWYEFEITLKDSLIKVFIDNEIKIEIVDNTPLRYGKVGFSSNPDSKLAIDDIVISGNLLDYIPDEDKEGLPVCQLSDYKWINTGGPSGGLGYDIRIHPEDKNMMFVTDNPSGVNKSVNGGLTWFQSNNGIESRGGFSGDAIPIFSLTIDKNKSEVIWAGTQNSNNIYKSEDKGESWILKNNGIQEESEISFRGFAVHPQNSNIVLCATEISTSYEGHEFNKTKGKIYKTIDGGELWYPVWEGNNLARVLIYNPENPDILYCSTGIFDREAFNSNYSQNEPGGEGVLKSTDGGETWFNSNNGLDNLYIGFLEMDPSDPNVLYAAAYTGTYEDFSGIYKTTNGAISWQKVLDHPHPSVVTISPSNTDIVYALGQSAVYRSNDSGYTWQKFIREDGQWGPPGIAVGFPISGVVDPENPMKIFVNNYGGGNFVSKDGGITWLDASKGYTGANIQAVSINKNNPFDIVVGTRGGPFKSINGGVDWHGIYYSGQAPYECSAIEFFPDNSSEILAASDAVITISKSIDGGYSWDVPFELNLDRTDGFNGVSSIRISKSDPDIVFFSTSHIKSVGSFDGTGIPSLGLFKSVDRGQSWVAVNSGIESYALSINTIEIHPTNPNIVYIGTVNDGIYKTINGGQYWNRCSNGLGFSKVTSIAIDPKNTEILYAGSGDGNGIYKSIDGAETWFECNSGIQVECPSNLLVAGNTKSGKTLEKPLKHSNTNYSVFIPWTKIIDIEIDPMNTNNVYASDINTGVYLSKDKGEKWYSINNGLNYRAATKLSISEDGRVLYAGTWGGGVFRLIVNGSFENREICEGETYKTWNVSGQYTDTLASSTGIDSIIYTNLKVHELPNPDFINKNDTLSSIETYTSYQWYNQDGVIEGATSSQYIIQESGTYYVEVTNKNGCSAMSDGVNLIKTGINGLTHNKQLNLTVVPNPNDGKFWLRFKNMKANKFKFQVINELGQIQLEKEVYSISGSYEEEFDLSHLPKGNYFIKVSDGESINTQKIILN